MTGGTRQPGSQTLARGLHALLTVSASPTGISSTALAAALGVHRSIAYRILQTLGEFGFVTRTDDGLYHSGAQLAALSGSYLHRLRHLAVPVMRTLADELGATISLFVREGREAVAIEIVEPTTVSHHLAFRPGMRTPIDRGAAGYALLSAEDAGPGDVAEAVEARRRGYASSHGEIDPNAYAVAARVPGCTPAACLNLITYHREQAESSPPRIREAAEEIGVRLAG
ncbi:IclR family transcriptional regulator [Amycolatopsis jejuensis]|uniref:IclR family transcriptional regulator n=1 Tax=Amycolatopsis jejuensis TaxID=330084 RepID=UPI0005249C74|nr:helix-turn-helix domain-containing protein [Amycolatopsis jejuensis]